jgi:hypothetical protein
MKRKTLFEIALKITGLLALWNFLQSVGGIGIAFGILNMFASGAGIQNQFMGFIAINTIASVIIPGLIAFFCLFRTQRISSILKLEAGAEEKVDLNPRVVYNLFVLAIAVVIFMDGCAKCMIFSYNRDTKTETNISYNQDPASNNDINDNVTRDTSSVTQKETKNVNYLAFAEIIMGIIIFLKSAEISHWLYRRYNDGFEEQKLKLSDLKP